MTEAVHVRFSSLKRHPRLDRDAFSRHYREVHGPLACSLAGFRRYTYRYVQNHVVGAAEPMFDGVTQTWQVPRRDLARGFFQTADYPVIRADEEILFDLSRTFSAIGRMQVTLDGVPSAHKAMVFAAGDVAADAPLPGLVRRTHTRLLPELTGALGGGNRPSPFGQVIELWFADAESLRATLQRPGLRFGTSAVVLEVREIPFLDAPRPAFLEEP